MKLALLSFHNAANYGAALQAYALQKCLLIRGYNCEYINYINKHRKYSYDMSYHIVTSLINRSFKSAIAYLCGSPFMYLRKLRFKKFYKKNLIITSKIYRSAVEASSLNTLYDKFIVGSDQVWNLENNGNDMSFLLSFVDDTKKKISYSSSFGVSSIESRFLLEYKKYLADIKYLSTREQKGVEIIKDLIGRDATLVVDPVYLLSKENWLKLVDNSRKKEAFVFFYTNKPLQMENFLDKTKYPMNNKKIYLLARNTKIADFLSPKVRVKYTMSPTDFLTTINDAELVVSASFHCISLSIILNKPFIAILVGDEGKDSRLLSILNYLGLQHRIYRDDMTLEDVMRPIDYDNVNDKIELFKKSSIEFLISSIESN